MVVSWKTISRLPPIRRRTRPRRLNLSGEPDLPEDFTLGLDYDLV